MTAKFKALKLKLYWSQNCKKNWFCIGGDTRQEKKRFFTYL